MSFFANKQQCIVFRNWLKGFLLTLGLMLAPLAYGTEQIVYYHFDALGSPVAASDATGNYYLWKETYQPYGDRIQKQPTANNNNRWYTGKPQDDETGLSYFGARYYDPVIGRFMGVDPKEFIEVNPHSFNRYVYGNNNPYKYIDPDGKNAEAYAVGTGVLLIGGYIIYVTSGPEQRAQIDRAITWIGERASDRMRSLTGSIFNESSEPNEGPSASPHIDPKDVAGKNPGEIDQLARERGLQPKGPDPKGGKGSYVDPTTGEQRILCHPNCSNPHAHVNDPSGNRLDINGNPVPPESPEAHIPIQSQ